MAQQDFDWWMMRIYPRIERKFLEVTSLSFSPDGSRLLFGTSNGICGYWSLAAGGAEFLGNQSRETSFFTFAPDGMHALRLGAAKSVQLLEVTTGATVSTLSGHRQVTAAFVPGRPWVLAGGEDCTVALWDFQAGRILHPFSDYHDIISSLAVAPDGQTFLSSTLSGDGRTVLRRTEGGDPHVLADVGCDVWSSAISADGRLAGVSGGSCNSEEISIFDIGTRRQITTIRGAGGLGGRITFAPDSSFVIRAGTGSNAAILFDPLSGQERARLIADSGVKTAAVSWDGRLAATAGLDGTVLIWDLERHSWIARLCILPGSWLVLDREGRFDTSGIGDDGIPTWGMHPFALEPVPSRSSVAEFFVEGLLRKVLKR